MKTQRAMSVTAAAAILASCGLVSAQECAWIRIPVNPGDPTARASTTMTYDSARSRTVLFGGANFYPFSVAGDTWEWDGSTWSPRVVKGPGPRYNHAMAYDSARHRVVLFGGTGPGGQTILRDTWEWDGASWMRRADGPAMQGTTLMAFDAARGRCVAYGAIPGGATMEWDGTAWSINQVAGPGAAAGTTMVYDTQRARIAFVGGQAGNGATTTVWEYDGIAWTQRIPIGLVPPGRSSASAAYDAQRGRLILVGGREYLASPAGTWEWDSASGTWSHPRLGQPGIFQYGCAAVWDSGRQRTVLFGQRYYGGPDMFEYNGNGTSPFDVVHQPISQTVPALTNVTLVASAPGATSYQWYQYSTPLVDNSLFSGTNTSALTITRCPTSTTGIYSVVAQGTCGPAYGAALLLVDATNCYANCDHVGGLVGGEDFQCFLDAYVANLSYANCDGSTGTPMLTANDFFCFLNSFLECQGR